ncbi:GNAT family N-acetyltransferase [Paraferrimonas sedimenticola]|uniref:N-acetyltransferase n=1 Tax=Paraferrimonas sedimenticola TaxID=375674 RepID=A0AA37VTF0_9GAMM|nr:GNAT family N-acetyltransferase [Paraferrimonas sedimenticola]GLP95261.1 N-acetyltransferase [Paraferrimonas sedimenticola]
MTRGQIRHATQTDLAAIVDIYNQSIPAGLATADTQAVSVASRQAWFEAHHDKRPLWVLEEKRQILGWCSLRDFYGRPAYQITAEVAIYVADSAQGKGVAKTLLKHAISKAPSLGLETLLAFIFSHNTPSINLFERFGFSAWGQLPELAAMPQGKVSLTILGLKLAQ